MSEQEQDFSFKSLFVPLNTLKAIHWIVITGIVVYANMLFNNFVVDDLTYIINNPEIHAFNILTAFGQNSFNNLGQYRAITYLYFSLVYPIFGNTAFFYHLTQLCLHISCAVLLFKFFSKYLPKFVALLSVLIFLIHPMQVESVSYISQTSNSLLTLFGLIALLLISKKETSTKTIALSCIFLLLAVLTKETGALFVSLVFIYRLIFNRKKFGHVFFGLLTVVIVYSILRFSLAQVGLTVRTLTPIADLTIFQRMISMPSIFFYYISTFVFPSRLSFDQEWVIKGINFSSFYLPVLLDALFITIMTLLGVILYSKRSQYFKAYVFFSCWFFFGILLLIQIFPLDKTVSNTWFYFPLMGLVGILGVTYQNISCLPNKVRLTITSVSIFLIAALSMRTIFRNTNWSDDITLQNHDIQVDDNYEIETSLGFAYMSQKDYGMAIEHLQKAIEMRPYEYNLMDLGLAYAYSGNLEKAQIYLTQALHAKSYNLYNPKKHDIMTYLSGAAILMVNGKYSEASDMIQNSGLRDYPNSWQLWKYLALAKNQQDDKKGAYDAAIKANTYYQSETGSPLYTSISDSPVYSSKDLYNMLFIAPLR